MKNASSRSTRANGSPARQHDWPLESIVSDAEIQRDLLILRAYGARSRKATHSSIELGKAAWATPGWSSDLHAITERFALSAKGNPLRLAGHDWLWPLERQTTEGLAYFLNHARLKIRTARCLALLRAIGAPDGIALPEELKEARAVAEHPAPATSARGSKAGRIDLLVSGRSGGADFGAVIEAKFGHDLRNNPLRSYLAAAESEGLTPGNCSFIVVGVAKDQIVRERLSIEHDWRFMGWRRLLIAFERFIDPDADDDDFRRFRRLLFDRAKD